MSLCVRNLNQYYGKKLILKSVSFEAPAGSIIALLGPNGAGKTTLLRSVMGLQKVKIDRAASVASDIVLNGHPISSWQVWERIREGLVYVPQHSSLFLTLSVHDNLKLIYYYHDYWRNKGSSLPEFETEMNAALKRTNLTESLMKKAGILSGGQKRKLEVVRALLLHPRVIMFDEPFAGVDPKSIYELKEIFLELARAGMAVVISDHHVDQLLSIATTIYVIVAGEVVVFGGIKEIMENEYTKTMYLGHQFHSEMLDRYLK